MIKNDHQLAYTTAQLEKLKYALDHMVGNDSPLIAKAQRDGLESIIGELTQEITDYLAVKGEAMKLKIGDRVALKAGYREWVRQTLDSGSTAMLGDKKTVGEVGKVTNVFDGFGEPCVAVDMGDWGSPVPIRFVEKVGS